MVVLTKGDLLDCTALAQCILAVQLDLAPFVQPKKRQNRDSGHEGHQDDAASTTTQHGVVAEMKQAKVVVGVDDREKADGVEGAISDLSDSDSDFGEDGEGEGENEDLHSDSDSDTDSDSGSDSGEEESEGLSPAQAEMARMAAEEPDEHYVPEKVDVPHKHLVPVHVISSSTGAGIPGLWKRLCGIAKEDSIVATSLADATHIVREHRLASSLRRKHVTQKASPQVRAGRERNPHDLRPRDAHKRPILVCKNRRRVRDRMTEPVKVVETPLTGFTER